mmetsp:Transcript_25206/g.63999  ORF Transcript_25206/g.63999 Transcript_25206/m.63999 type:complete len:323 (-) Transcript_25206:30-998(-)
MGQQRSPAGMMYMQGLPGSVIYKKRSTRLCSVHPPTHSNPPLTQLFMVRPPQATEPDPNCLPATLPASALLSAVRSAVHLLEVLGQGGAEGILLVLGWLRPVRVGGGGGAEAARRAAPQALARGHPRALVHSVRVAAQRLLLQLVQQRVGEVGAIDVGAAQVGPREDGALQVGLAQVGLVDDGAVHQRVAQVGALKVGPEHDRLDEVRALQVGVRKVGLLGAGGREVGATQVLVAEVLAIDISLSILQGCSSPKLGCCIILKAVQVSHGRWTAHQSCSKGTSSCNQAHTLLWSCSRHHIHTPRPGDPSGANGGHACSQCHLC